MKNTLKFLITFALFHCASNLVSQNLLNLPESVVYDSLHQRYLVSNWGSGDVVQISDDGVQSIFLDNEQCFAGLHIQDSVLYVACREYGVKGYNLNSGENVLDVDITGVPNINDITADNSGNLYVSSPPGNAIFKINISTGQWWIFVDADLSFPNGLYFDEPNNRLIVVSYRMNSPIQEVNFSDSTAMVIIYPGLNNLDGISQDNDGNYYISSWYYNKVYKFDNTFSNPPEVFSEHNDDPADICFDTVNNVLAVPLFFTHQVEFVEAGTGINISNVSPVSETILMQNYPNPFNPSTTISFNLFAKDAKSAKLEIYNLKGQKVKQFISDSTSQLSAGQHSVVWDGKDNEGKPVGSGLYLCTLKINGKIKAVKKCLLMK